MKPEDMVPQALTAARVTVEISKTGNHSLRFLENRQ